MSGMGVAELVLHVLAGCRSSASPRTCMCVACFHAGVEVRESFSKAMAIWERETCIQFVNRTTEEDYLTLGER